MRGGAFSATLSVLTLVASIAHAQGVSFRSSSVDITVGAAPNAVAIGDFNGDTKPDMAVANLDSDNVSVLWGNGDGTFLDSDTLFPVGLGPWTVAVADFNKDQKPDIVTADSLGNTVSVLLNQGGTVFGTAIQTNTGNSPIAIVVADFNKDGNLDVATADSFDNTVTVLLGTGDGHFVPAAFCSNQATQSCRQASDCGSGNTCQLQRLAVGTAPQGLAVGNLDGDNNLDLVVTNSAGGEDASGTISVLKGAGTGAFVVQPELTSATFDVPVAVAVADLRGVGKLDLVVVNEDSDTASILLGNGDGTFQEATSEDVGSFPEAVVVADFNGDGKLDIATSGNFEDAISVLLGNGDGSFMPTNDFSVGAGPTGIATADLNNDSKPDLVAANIDDETVSVLLNTTGQCPGDCDGSGDVDVSEVVTLVDIALGVESFSQCQAGDVDGDGSIEINELIAAVNNALNGCPAPPVGTPTPTPTPTQPPTPTRTPT